MVMDLSDLMDLSDSDSELPDLDSGTPTIIFRPRTVTVSIIIVHVY
jgi:hypothetical protein